VHMLHKVSGYLPHAGSAEQESGANYTGTVGISSDWQPLIPALTTSSMRQMYYAAHNPAKLQKKMKNSGVRDPADVYAN